MDGSRRVVSEPRDSEHGAGGPRRTQSRFFGERGNRGRFLRGRFTIGGLSGCAARGAEANVVLKAAATLIALLYPSPLGPMHGVIDQRP
jgi:hypothetical protein